MAPQRTAPGCHVACFRRRLSTCRARAAPALRGLWAWVVRRGRHSQNHDAKLYSNSASHPPKLHPQSNACSERIGPPKPTTATFYSNVCLELTSPSPRPGIYGTAARARRRPPKPTTDQKQMLARLQASTCKTANNGAAENRSGLSRRVLPPPPFHLPRTRRASPPRPLGLGR